MIAYSKDSKHTRFNPVLGSSYKLEKLEQPKNGLNYVIYFQCSNKKNQMWYFKKKEAAEETLEWLDQRNGVQFIPSQTLKIEE